MRTRMTALPWLAALAVVLVMVGCSQKPAPQPITPAPVERAEPRAAEPAAEPPRVPAPVETKALADVYFDYDKHQLRSDAIRVLTGNAEYLQGNPEARALIEGHCDERGTIEYNLALGDKRARAARDFLVNYGINAARLETISYGEERPFAPGHDESSWSQNRRAHFVAR